MLFTDWVQEIVLVSYKVKIAVAVEKIGEFLDFCHSIANEFRHEKGYRVLQVYRDREDSDTFILISEWESEKSMEDHLRGETFSLLKGGAIVLGQNFKLIIGEAVTIDNSRWQRLNLPW